MKEFSRINKKDGGFVQDERRSKNTLYIGSESKRIDTRKTVGETRLFLGLNISYKWMSFAGLLYLSDPTETVKLQKSMKQKFYMTYQCFIDVLTVIAALCHFTEYSRSMDTSHFILSFLLHSYMIAIAVLSCMRPYIERHINQFIIKIYKHKMNNCDRSSIHRLEKCIRFYVISICVFSLLSDIVFNWVAVLYEYLNSSGGVTESSLSFYPSFLFIGFAHIIGTVRLYGILAHCFAMSHFLTLEYIHLAQTIRSRMTEITDDDLHFLESHRARFETLNDLVKHVNRFSKMPLAFVIFYCLFELCLIIYGLLQYMQPIEVYVLCIWTGFSVLFTVSLIAAGISLNSSAHQLTDDLYAIDLHNLSPEASLKVSIFLYRLTGPPIGISVAGLFIIDHSTVLMLTGTLLTYIIVVIQTKGPDCGSQNQNINNITMPGI